MVFVATSLYLASAIWLYDRVSVSPGVFLLVSISVFGVAIILSFGLGRDDSEDANPVVRLSYALMVGGGVVFLIHGTRFVSTAEGSGMAILTTALGLVAFMVGVAGLGLGDRGNGESTSEEE